MLKNFFLRLEMRQKWLSLKLYWRSLTTTIGNKKFKDWIGRNEAIFFPWRNIFGKSKRISQIGITQHVGFPGGTSGKEASCQRKRHKKCGFYAWLRKIPSGRDWQPAPVFLPGKSHGQGSLAGYSPLGHEELDTTERLSTHT